MLPDLAGACRHYYCAQPRSTGRSKTQSVGVATMPKKAASSEKKSVDKKAGGKGAHKAGDSSDKPTNSKVCPIC